MLLRTFNNRSIEFMKFCWKVYIQPLIDYASQLWAPSSGPWLKKLENILKSFSSKIDGIKHLDYWQRLKTLKICSIQRRFERYRIMYTWKILKGIVPICDLSWKYSTRAGILLMEPPLKKFQKLSRENSFHYNGTRLFNTLPRTMSDNLEATKDEWKLLLDEHLSLIPDHPAVDCLVPEPCDHLYSNACNSVLSWS